MVEFGGSWQILPAEDFTLSRLKTGKANDQKRQTDRLTDRQTRQMTQFVILPFQNCTALNADKTTALLWCKQKWLLPDFNKNHDNCDHDDNENGDDDDDNDSKMIIFMVIMQIIT